MAVELLTSDFRTLSADGAGSPLYRNEQKPVGREPGTPHSLPTVS
jgi:hypothetical protein